MTEQRWSRWFWVAAASLLAVGLAGYVPAIGTALALVVLRVAHLAVARGLNSFALQVHATYLLLLAVGYSAGLAFMHWNLLIGTLIYIATDYCILARCLALLPWNRAEPLTWHRVGRTFVSRPVENILQSAAADAVQHDDDADADSVNALRHRARFTR